VGSCQEAVCCWCIVAKVLEMAKEGLEMGRSWLIALVFIDLGRNDFSSAVITTNITLVLSVKKTMPWNIQLWNSESTQFLEGKKKIRYHHRTATL
jgi:hypothetical protein